MKIKSEDMIGFEGKPKYRDKFQFSSIEGNYTKKDNHEFVVPWQMNKKKKEEFIMK